MLVNLIFFITLQQIFRTKTNKKTMKQALLLSLLLAFGNNRSTTRQPKREAPKHRKPNSTRLSERIFGANTYDKEDSAKGLQG